MAKTLATIEIAIEQHGEPAAVVKATLQLKGDSAYTISLSKPVGQPEIMAVNSDSPAPATAWMVQRLKQILDEFALSTSTVKVVADTLNLLPKVTYRCPNPGCRAKLFESWGTAQGIRIVCRKCKTLGIPQPENKHNA